MPQPVCRDEPECRVRGCEWSHPDQTLCEGFLEKLSLRIHRYFSAQVHDKYIADDLLGETLLRFIRSVKSGQFNILMPPTPYVFQIARNALRNHWRRQREFEIIDDLVRSVDWQDDTEDMLRWIREKGVLSSYQYTLIEMSVQGHKPGEIARLLNDDPRRVRRELHRAREKIRGLRDSDGL
jgi:RNA polymerase sigma factor (sigma-70 family)